jgi:drug/metabolite transporter (DMT)-like permease
MTETGSHRHHTFPGVPLALGSALLFGLTPPLSKLLLTDVSPLLLAGLLYLGAGLGLGAYLLIAQTFGERQEAGLARKDIPWLLLAILAGGIAGPILLMVGLSRTSAGSASLLLNMESLFTMAIAWVVFRENVDRRLLLGAFAILAGAVLLSWQGEGLSIDAGALLVMGACLAWGIDNNLTRNISAADPIAIACIKGLVAGSVNTVIAFANGAGLPPVLYATGGAVLGFFGIGVSLVLFILALRHLGTARTGAYYSLAPFVGAAIAILVLGEPATWRFLLAAALMGLGLWLHLSENHSHVHEHEELEHDHLHVHDVHHRHVHGPDVPAAEPHSHWHRHASMRHKHPHYPDIHHRHSHSH